MIRIHNFARGARGQRAMWLCEEMGLPYSVEIVKYPPSAAYLALNPLGTVPFLEDEGGVAINESIAMLFYIAAKYGPTPLLPGKDDPACARVLQITEFGEATIGAGINPLIVAKFAAPDAEKRSWLVTAQEARMEQAIRHAAHLLGDKQFFAGDQLTLADISVCCALGIWRGALGLAIPDTLTAFRERLAERPAYQRALLRVKGEG